jgi:hypothetical protein
MPVVVRNFHLTATRLGKGIEMLAACQPQREILLLCIQWRFDSLKDR